MVQRGLSEFKLEDDCDGAAQGVDLEGEAAAAPPPSESESRKSKKKGRELAGRHKGGNSKNYRVCKACGVKKPESEFSLNQAVDMSCKCALDNIFKQAKAQGPQAVQFVQETKADPVKCKKMLDSYNAAYKAWCNGQKAGKIKWSMMEYKESVEAESGVRLSENQQMMWERQALVFWQSVDGGAHTEEEAQSKWDKLAARVGDADVISDHKGPSKKPLRLAIIREDMVYNYSQLAKKRKVEFSDKAQKKVDDAGIQKTVKRVMSNHDSVAAGAGGLGSIPSGAELGSLMVQGGAGSAFDGVNMQVGDVRNLVPAADADPNTDEHDAPKKTEEDGDDNMGSEPEEKDDPKKTKWFDKDRAVNNAQKALAAQEKKLLETYETRMKELEEALETINNMSNDEKVHYKGEEKIASVRLQFLKALKGSATDLADLIGQFSSTGPSPVKGPPPCPEGVMPADGATTAAGVAALGNSPPSKQFKELRTLAELSLCKDYVLQSESADEIAEHKKEFARMKAPISDLLGSVQAGSGSFVLLVYC